MADDHIEFYSFDGSVALASLLKLTPPPFVSHKDAFAQVKYLEDYLLRPDMSDLAERTVMVEDRYVDRDFMADHTVLFASTLEPPPNYCRRLHFFTGAPEAVYTELLRRAASLADGSPEAEAAVLSRIPRPWLRSNGAAPNRPRQCRRRSRLVAFVHATRQDRTGPLASS